MSRIDVPRYTFHLVYEVVIFKDVSGCGWLLGNSVLVCLFYPLSETLADVLGFFKVFSSCACLLPTPFPQRSLRLNSISLLILYTKYRIILLQFIIVKYACTKGWEELWVVFCIGNGCFVAAAHFASDSQINIRLWSTMRLSFLIFISHFMNSGYLIY